jgi:hypothetical protein
MYIWSGILFEKTCEYPRLMRMFTRIMLISTLLVSSLVYRGVSACFVAAKYPNEVRCFQQIKDIGARFSEDKKPSVTIVARDHWKAVGIFIAPTLYMNRNYVTESYEGSFENCVMVIAPLNYIVRDKRFIRYSECKMGGTMYAVNVMATALPVTMKE